MVTCRENNKNASEAFTTADQDEGFGKKHNRDCCKILIENWVIILLLNYSAITSLISDALHFLVHALMQQIDLYTPAWWILVSEFRKI